MICGEFFRTVGISHDEWSYHWDRIEGQMAVNICDMENCDEEFPAFSATDIQAELSAEEININADRRAIYTDIAAIRDILGLDIEGTPSGKFRLKTRPFQYDDRCMIAECIYAAKFISDDHARRLIETLGRFASNPQADKLMIPLSASEKRTEGCPGSHTGSPQGD